MLPALFRLSDKLRPVPDLVESWPAPSDFTLDPFSVRLKLRRASWSDGRPITSADVRFSAAKLRAGPTGYRYRDLASVDVLSPRTLRLRFDRPVRRWWSLFSLDDMVLPEHAYSAAWASGPTVSGGPFAFKSWTKGLQVELTRNDSYTGDRARLRELDIQFVPDDETRLQLLREGKIDAFFAEGSPNMGRRARAYGFPDTTKALDGNGGSSGAWGPTWIELDMDAAKMSAPLRTAVVEGTGPALAAEIFEDSARRLDAIPPDFRGRPVTVPWRTRGDLAKAFALVKGTAASFQLGYPAGPAGAIANFMHFRFAPRVSIELAGVEPPTFEKAWVPQRKSPALLRIRRGADAPDAASYGDGPDVRAAESAGAGTGVVAGLDPAAWGRVEQGLHDAATVTPLIQLRSWIVGRAGVSGPHPAGTSEGPFAGAATWTLTPAG